MPNSPELKASFRTHHCPKTWKTFFQAHCDALFQTALLLSADPEEAEASVAATLDTIDFSKPPAESQVLILQQELAKRTIQAARPSPAPKISEARNLLQVELQPVLEIERFPRLCFVLRTFLGYASSACAQMLGIEETAVRALLRIAILQLQSTITQRISHPSQFEESPVTDGRGECLAVGSFIDPVAAHA